MTMLSNQETSFRLCLIILTFFGVIEATLLLLEGSCLHKKSILVSTYVFNINLAAPDNSELSAGNNSPLITVQMVLLFVLETIERLKIRCTSRRIDVLPPTTTGGVHTISGRLEQAPLSRAETF